MKVTPMKAVAEMSIEELVVHREWVTSELRVMRIRACNIMLQCVSNKTRQIKILEALLGDELSKIRRNYEVIDDIIDQLETLLNGDEKFDKLSTP